MEVNIKVTGSLLILLALVHIVFPKYFNWKDELIKLSLVNRQMMYVHTFFIALMLILMGTLCLTSAKEIIETELGKRLSLGFGIFWTIRLFIQFFGYSSNLWKKKRFEGTIHILFSLLWFYFSVVFFYLYFKSIM
jgi:hypothetical protein